jgi:hypothetical protein
MEVDLQSLFGLHVTCDVHSCTHWPRNPPPPPLVYDGANGQQRLTTSLCNPLISGDRDQARQLSKESHRYLVLCVSQMTETERLGILGYRSCVFMTVALCFVLNQKRPLVSSFVDPDPYVFE